MINKLDLQSIISKYYLNGMNEAVKWEIKDNNLTIKFTSPDRSMIGVVTYEGFELEDSTIGISNTTQLNKLLAITNGYLSLEYQKQHKLITKLIVADNQFTLNYALADTMIIPKAGEFIGDVDANPVTLESFDGRTRRAAVVTPRLNPRTWCELVLDFFGDQMEVVDSSNLAVSIDNIDQFPR